MARHKKQQRDPDANPELDISSLIDVCFLLLIYFLVTSTIKPRETDLDMALPSSQPTDQQPKLQPMFIRIEANGQIYVNTGPAQQALDSDPTVREVPLLRSQLEVYAGATRAANEKPIVQIYADGDASQQRVVDVLNALSSVGIDSVTFTDLIDS